MAGIFILPSGKNIAFFAKFILQLTKTPFAARSKPERGNEVSLVLSKKKCKILNLCFSIAPIYIVRKKASHIIKDIFR